MKFISVIYKRGILFASIHSLNVYHPFVILIRHYIPNESYNIIDHSFYSFFLYNNAIVCIHFTLIRCHNTCVERTFMYNTQPKHKAIHNVVAHAKIKLFVFDFSFRTCNTNIVTFFIICTNNFQPHFEFSFIIFYAMPITSHSYFIFWNCRRVEEL